MGEKATADAQYEAQVANGENMRNSAISDMVQQSADLNSREEQERAATGVRNMNQSTAARQASATAAATSESAGLSLDGLLNDYDRQYFSYADSQMQQLGFNVEQIGRQREGLKAQAQSRINSVPMRPVSYPSLAGSLIEFGGSALSAYDNFSVRDPITGNRTLT
jgi:hypothetical protein